MKGKIHTEVLPVQRNEKAHLGGLEVKEKVYMLKEAFYWVNWIQLAQYRV